MIFQSIKIRFLSNYEDDESSFKYELKIFSVFFSRLGVSRSPPYNKIVDGSRLDKSGSGLACMTQLQGTQLSRVPLDTSETLCPSHFRPAWQVTFHVFRPEKRIPARKTYLSVLCVSSAIIRILFAGKCGKLCDPYFTCSKYYLY
jgi:hypothetical protein